MSFAFNFGSSAEPEQADSSAKKTKTDTASEPRVAKEIPLSAGAQSGEDQPTVKVSFANGIELQVVDIVAAKEKIASSLPSLEKSQTDIIPGVYEGGFKAWECSIDLVNYLSTNSVLLKGKRVLEVGCGAAYPGLYAASCGAIIDFQDYNEEVLCNVTIPNYTLNPHAGKVKSRFFAGDWSLLKTFIGKRYDIVLTAETIYSERASASLYDFLTCVVAPEGIAYVAAKTYYFGVGGGTRDFEARVLADKKFSVEVSL